MSREKKKLLMIMMVNILIIIMRKIKEIRKTQVFWHHSEARMAATVWNWSGKTLSQGALLAVVYFSFVPYFPARLDFLSPPLSAPGSPRMCEID